MKKKTQRFPIAFLFLFAAVAMMAYGIYRGEMQVVLEKAIRVCMECIGIG